MRKDDWLLLLVAFGSFLAGLMIAFAAVVDLARN